MVIGTNTWEEDMDKNRLIKQLLRWAKGLKAQGIAELIGAWMASDKNLLWCTWETENLEALKAAFVELNEQTGLKSELTIIDRFYPD